MHTKTLAIMQPYLFPYIGYMSLVYASDTFVFYDDVSFIKSGWINRNNIILMEKPYRFTVPLIGQSSNKLIKDIEVSNLEDFSKKFLSQLELSYKNSAYKNAVLGYVEEVLHSGSRLISDLARISVENFFNYVGIEKIFLVSSLEFSETRDLNRVERLIAISEKLNADHYLNVIGGKSIYSREDFEKRGVSLQFLKPLFVPYSHCNLASQEFHPGLSIIDIMANLSVNEIRSHLSYCEIS